MQLSCHCDIWNRIDPRKSFLWLHKSKWRWTCFAGRIDKLMDSKIENLQHINLDHMFKIYETKKTRMKFYVQ